MITRETRRKTQIVLDIEKMCSNISGRYHMVVKEGEGEPSNLKDDDTIANLNQSSL